MLAGDFGYGFETAFASLPLVLLLVIGGLLAFQMSGHGMWRVPLAVMGGMLLGVLAAHLEMPMPYAGWVPLGAIAVIGLGVALRMEPPTWLAMGAVAVPALYIGRQVLGLGELAAFTWVGLGVGLTIVMAASIGLANLIDSVGAGRVLQFTGGGIAVACILMLAGVIPVP